MNKIGTGIEGAAAAADTAKAATDAATDAATANAIVKRDASGRFKAAAPSASTDVARKAEVDAVGTVASAALPATSYTAADVLAKLLTVDSDTSGINATTVKGYVPVNKAGDTMAGNLIFDSTGAAANSASNNIQLNYVDAGGVKRGDKTIFVYNGVLYFTGDFFPIWHGGNDGPGSGLYAEFAVNATNADNANTVGGIAAASIYHTGNKPYVTGWYDGDGSVNRQINVGFTPSAAIVFPSSATTISYATTNGGLTAVGAPNAGIGVGANIQVTGGANTSGTRYSYMAFR